MNESFEITFELADKIAGYLGNRPYAEVSYLIDELRQAAANAKQTINGEEKEEEK